MASAITGGRRSFVSRPEGGVLRAPRDLRVGEARCADWSGGNDFPQG
jgi:hypothetical protein